MIINFFEHPSREQFATASPNSSTSSLALQTPKDAPFTNDLSDRHVIVNTTFSTDQAHDSSGNYPAISSMEVEVSIGTEPDVEAGRIISSTEVKIPEPKTPPPQRGAAEVFGFLTGRRKSTRERPLPSLPTPASTDVATPKHSPKSVLDAMNSSPISQLTSVGDASEAHVCTATVTKLSTAPATINSYASREQLNAFAQSSKDEDTPLDQERVGRDPVATRSRSVASSREPRQLPVPPPAPSKIPRGPRRPRSGSRSTERSRRRERSNGENSAYPSRSGPYPDRQHPHVDHPNYLTVEPTHQRSRSRSSGTTCSIAESSRRRVVPADTEDTTIPAPKTPAVTRSNHSHPRSHTSNTNASSCDKENTPSPTTTQSIVKPSTTNNNNHAYNHRRAEPLTPTTPGRSRIALDVRCSHLNIVEPPSPPSSSELSPIAREIMADLREKRSRARDRVSSRTALR